MFRVECRWNFYGCFSKTKKFKPFQLSISLEMANCTKSLFISHRVVLFVLSLSFSISCYLSISFSPFFFLFSFSITVFLNYYRLSFRTKSLKNSSASKRRVHTFVCCGKRCIKSLNCISHSARFTENMRITLVKVSVFQIDLRWNCRLCVCVRVFVLPVGKYKTTQNASNFINYHQLSLS